MEKLKTEIMLYALKEIKKANIGIDNLKDKDIQEAIYQLEDIVADKAFLKNKSKNCKHIDNLVNFRLRDMVDLLKMKLRLAEYVDMSSKAEIILHSKSNHKINTRATILYPTPYEEDGLASQRTYACSYLVNSLIKMLLPYVSKTDFTDAKEYFQMEIKRRNQIIDIREELTNKAEV
tara:strand:+ start:49 stop:579 length:531 start_codon:yes stop_codon:yes gene_type:complete